MATFKTPGVYVEEISTLAPSVAPVPTSIPGFAGYTEKAIINGEQWNYGDGTTNPVRVTSLLEYQEIFGFANNEDFTVTLNDPQDSPVITIDRTTALTAANYILYYQMQMFFANGGGTCYVSSVGDYTMSISASDLKDGIDKMEQIDEVTLLVAPESVFLDITGDRADVYNNMLTQCQKMEDRFAILDVVHKADNSIQEDADDFRDDDVGADNLKYGASYYPGLNTTIPYSYQDSNVLISDQRTSNPLNGLTLDQIAPGVPTPYTQIYTAIVNELALQRLLLYPSASMAGIYARVDSQRGVWKAPANTGILSISRPAIQITDQEQENLNVDSVSGKSINAIRQFAGRGNLVWGARTLAGNDNEWRYINVRRLFLYVEESIKKATEFVVFESNTATTWTKVRGTAEAFLTSLWRDGALAGATTQDAFFVHVGLGTTMTAQDILEGRMNVEIGLAAVRPAEFIILRFSHKLQES